MIDINIDRIQRLLALNDIRDAVIGYDENFSSYFLKYKNNAIHLFPGYNQNYLKDQNSFASKLFICNATAVVPSMNLQSNAINAFKVLERPNLFTIQLSADLNLLWSNIRAKRQRSIEYYSDILRFEVADENNPFVDIFINLYLKLQVQRAVPLVNFFDYISLNSIVRSSDFKLFYSVNIKLKESILFHLVRINGASLEYLFSANTDLESRNYSAFLHWNIIKWSKREFECSASYDLGGGVAKDDGIERFKREIGGIAQPRWYLLYPMEKYVEGEFFPLHAKFLNMKNFLSN